jgi:hypothetical protein
MSCPHLKEVRMVICRAYPVKKPVPIDRVTTESTCDERYETCPLYQEALARTEGSSGNAKTDGPTEARKGATP